MSFGQNFYNLFMNNAQPIVLVGLGAGAIYLLYKRKLAEFVAFVVVGLIAVGFVFNPTGVKDVLLKIFDQVVTSGTALKMYVSGLHFIGFGL